MTSTMLGDTSTITRLRQHVEARLRKGKPAGAAGIMLEDLEAAVRNHDNKRILEVLRNAERFLRLAGA